MRNYLKLVLLLTACHPSIHEEVAQEDRKVISITKQAWRELGQPNPKDCLEDVGVQAVSAENFKFTCGTSPKLSIGCIRDRKDGSLAGGDKILFISPEVHPAARERVLVQLSLHALCSCTSEDYRDKTDKLQMRPGVWKQSAGGQSVEALVYMTLRNK